MSVAALLPDQAPLYDAGSRRFAPTRLKWEMVRRNISPEELAKRTGRGITTINKARRGDSIRESTAMRIWKELDRIEPMSLGSV